MLEVPGGKLPLHSSKPAPNTSASQAEAAAIAAKYVESQYLERAFFQADESTLYLSELPSGGKLSVKIPTGPYAEGSVIVVAAGRDSLAPGHQETEVVYDYPQDVQRAYWSAAITCLRYFTEQVDPDSTTVTVVENCLIKITGEKRNSRSVRLPHLQVVPIRHEHIVDEEWKQDHLDFERSILGRPYLMAAHLRLLQRLYSQDNQSELKDLTHHAQPPFGYSFEVGDQDDIEQITAVMQAHHRAYDQVIQRTLAKLTVDTREKLIDQPAYRLYLHLEAGKIVANISPELVSKAGAMESLGIELNRSQDNEQRTSDAELAESYERVKQRVQAVMSPKVGVYRRRLQYV